MTEAFIYIWNDKLTSRMYLGSHKGTPKDGYVCSSKLMLEEYSKRPTDFSRIILTYGSLKNIRRMEALMLQKVDAMHNPMYYNQHNGNGDFIIRKNTEKAKEKMRLNQIPHNKMRSERMLLNNPMKNLASIQKMLDTRGSTKGHIPWNKGINGYKRTSHSEETKQKIRQKALINHINRQRNSKGQFI